MSETEKSEGETVTPPTVPIRGINVPDPTTSHDREGEKPVDGATGHEAFEKAKAASKLRE